MPTLLVVDDEPIICHSFRRVFASPDVRVVTAGTLAEGWRRVEEDRPDVIVLDLQLPAGSGLDLFERVRAADPRRPVVFVTAHGTTETAIEAMKHGAFDYLAKPLDLEEVSALLGRAFEAARLMREPAALPDDPRGDRLIGRSAVVREMGKVIGRVAPRDVNVLITGERVGGSEPITTRVRVLAATNQNLEALIAAGRFRGDLYYRLKEVTIRVPPLRDRKEDIPELAHHFLFQFAREADRDVRGFAPEVLTAFQNHPWPGNVRELRGVIRDAALRTTGRLVLPEFLPPELAAGQPAPAAPPADGLDLAGTIEGMLRSGEKGMHGRVVGAVERELIARVLRHTHGHQGQACELLGIDRKTLRNN